MDPLILRIFDFYRVRVCACAWARAFVCVMIKYDVVFLQTKLRVVGTKYGSMEVWKYGSMEVWKYESMEIWKYGSGKYGSVNVWKYKSMRNYKLRVACCELRVAS